MYSVRTGCEEPPITTMFLTMAQVWRRTCSSMEAGNNRIEGEGERNVFRVKITCSG